MFLASDWWADVSRRKRALVGKCERCPSRGNLQSHHRFYRDNWFDTKLEDLEVLCRSCHEKEHGIVPEAVRVCDLQPPQPAPTHTVQATGGTIAITTWRQLCVARSHKWITRTQYLALAPKLKPAKRIKRHRKFRRPGRTKRRHVEGVRPWFYNPTHRSKWVNRGTSSN